MNATAFATLDSSALDLATGGVPIPVPVDGEPVGPQGTPLLDALTPDWKNALKPFVKLVQEKQQQQRRRR